MLRNSNNALHAAMSLPPVQRLVYNGIDLIPVTLPLSSKPTYRWHIPGGAIMTTGELIDLAKIRNVVIKIIDYTKRPL